jgi:alkanesulfonate monooxygenase SsuD/methylene tetrahydromethanopterin reductase-like flavin-dependent oxidoreductase (luciferase family)
MEESQPRFEEAMEILRRAWTQDRFSFDGTFYKVQEVAVVPKPVQRPHPPLYVVGTSDNSFRIAGEQGFRVATGGPVPWTVAAHGIDTYKQACAASGHTPHVTFIRPVYFGDDQQHIRHEVEGFFRNYLHFNASAFDGLVSEDKKAELRAKGFGFYASGVVEQFRTMTYDQVLYRVERSIAMSLQELSLPYSEQILEFLAPGPSVQEILAFRPRLEIQERFSQLLVANRHRALTAQEEEELDHCIRIERMMALLKAKAYHRFDRHPVV